MTQVPKTPVSYLQEFCVKKKITPEYRVTDEGTSVHEPSFEYEVICGDYVTKGQGRTKKEAKHAAAEEMLSVLRNVSELNVDPVVNISSTVDNRKNPSFENKFVRDAVGPLGEFCFENKLSYPTFHEIRDEGPAHARMFTHRCSVEMLEVESTDRQKKQAKQQVALQMITYLKETVDPRIDRKIYDVSEFRFRDETALQNFNNVLENFPLSNSSYDTKFQPGDLSYPFLTDFERYNDYHDYVMEAFSQLQNSETDPEILLSKLLQKLEISCNICPLNCAGDEIMLFFSINLAPELNICETGSSYTDASRKAAIKALKYIKLFCSKPPSQNSDWENDISNSDNNE